MNTSHNLYKAHNLVKLYQVLVELCESSNYECYIDIVPKQKNGHNELHFYCDIQYNNGKIKKTLSDVIHYPESILTPTLTRYSQVWHEDALEDFIEAIKCSGHVDSVLTRGEFIDLHLADLV